MLAMVLLVAFKKKTPSLFEKPENWPEPVYNFKKNPLSSGKIELGRMLFYDPILSRDSTISCASCHSQYTAFTHIDHSLSHGIEGRIGTRNSPALMNLAWGNSFMWDGAIKHIDEQAIAPISNPLEMDENMEHVVYKLQISKQYPALFGNAYGDSVINKEKTLDALSQFMLTLISANSKYDSVMRGEAKFTEHQASGYKLFQSRCASCHTEPLFTNGKFENNGLFVDPILNDIGKMKVTHSNSDSLKFKVPTLRNIEYTKPYMHDGRFKNLGEVINSYMMGIQQSPTLNPQLQKGIFFTAEEKADIVAFLITLSDKAFLKNQKFSYPQK
jgi:cytochrome c peroxidase